MSDPHDPMEGVDRRLTELYRAGEAEQPSAEIDRRILEAAARRRRRWPLAGLATAAAAVLAVGLLLRLVPTPEPAAPAPAPADAAVPRAAAETARARAPQPGSAGETASLARLARSPTTLAAAAAMAAEPAAASYASAECPEPYPLPPGAVIRPLTDGIAVSDGDARFTLLCREGQWRREADEGPGGRESGATRP